MQDILSKKMRISTCWRLPTDGGILVACVANARARGRCEEAGSVWQRNGYGTMCGFCSIEYMRVKRKRLILRYSEAVRRQHLRVMSRER